jgi:hypothetical protein
MTADKQSERFCAWPAVSAQPVSAAIGKAGATSLAPQPETCKSTNHEEQQQAQARLCSTYNVSGNYDRFLASIHEADVQREARDACDGVGVPHMSGHLSPSSKSTGTSSNSSNNLPVGPHQQQVPTSQPLQRKQASGRGMQRNASSDALRRQASSNNQARTLQSCNEADILRAATAAIKRGKDENTLSRHNSDSLMNSWELLSNAQSMREAQAITQQEESRRGIAEMTAVMIMPWILMLVVILWSALGAGNSRGIEKATALGAEL